MAPEAVLLLVAADATLQVLSGCLRVAENPEGLTVVERGHHVSLALDSRSQMTLSTEPLRIVTGSAVADPAEGIRPVGGHEIQRMEGRRTESVVACHT